MFVIFVSPHIKGFECISDHVKFRICSFFSGLLVLSKTCYQPKKKFVLLKNSIFDNKKKTTSSVNIKISKQLAAQNFLGQPGSIVFSPGLFLSAQN